jgi:hypothetical protein
MDFLKRIKGGMIDSSAELDEKMLKRYGEKYGNAGNLQRGIMRLGAQSEDAEEMDLTPTFRAKVGEPTGVNPLDLYRKMYSTYGGRKMRGLLFD